MTPFQRKILYAVSFETLGIAVASLGLLLMSDANVAQSLTLSALTATIAMTWSVSFNALFETWEARQTTTGRSPARRALHAMGSLDEFDVVIVDDGTPPRTVDRMRARGIEVVVAPVPPQADAAQDQT